MHNPRGLLFAIVAVPTTLQLLILRLGLLLMAQQGHTDSLKQKGTALQKAWLTSLTQRCSVVHVVLYEKSQEEFSYGLPPNIIQCLQFHSFVDDPLGWNGGQDCYEQEIWKRLPDSSREGGIGVSVVIDSLSDLILNRSASYTCRVLQQLENRIAANGKQSVICLLHEDLHEEMVLQLVKYVADTVVRVCPPKDKSYHMSCHAIHKKVTGKILSSIEQVKFTSSFDLLETQELLQQNEVRPAQDKSKVDPAANLPFNLTLTESEKTARSQVELPYVHPHIRKKTPADSSTPGIGQIFYQPDEADDFDEEDPDDDLDI